MVTTSDSVTVEELAAISVFSDQSKENLEWLLSCCKLHELAANEVFFEEGAPADYMFIHLSGRVQYSANVGGALIPTFNLLAGEVTGLLPYSRLKNYPGEAVAMEPSRVLALHRDCFPEMLQRLPQIGERLVALLSDRVREVTRNQNQRDKLAALGTMSAGLAHELNNPAAALRRAAAELRDHLKKMPELAVELAKFNLRPDELEGADDVRETIADQADPVMSPLQRSEREDEIGSWLEGHGIDDAWMLSSTFVEEGFSIECLEDIATNVPKDGLGPVLAWINANLAAERLIRDIESAAGRISDLVKSIKTYSHMDRSPDKEETDVREGIDSTLVMMGHKLKKKSIEVRRQYAEELPRVCSFPGQLNQVWTNLIDNAIEAMPERGILSIFVKPAPHGICIKIMDNGKGIPPEIQPRIFEPFFTTKGVGEGTGLGLDVVNRIVTTVHGGTVRVESEPGRTVFEVWLPLKESNGVTTLPEPESNSQPAPQSPASLK